METHDIETTAGTYVVTTGFDDYCDTNPRRDHDHSATELYAVGYGGAEYVDELSGKAGAAAKRFIDLYAYAGNGDRFSDVERAYRKWVAITGSPVRLFTGTSRGFSQSAWHDWYMLVDTDVMQRERYGVSAEELADTEAREYAAWAFGDVAFYTVESPDGAKIDQCYGFIGYLEFNLESMMMDQARIAIKHDVEQRAEQASLVGAGFVGLI